MLDKVSQLNFFAKLLVELRVSQVGLGVPSLRFKHRRQILNVLNLKLFIAHGVKLSLSFFLRVFFLFEVVHSEVFQRELIFMESVRSFLVRTRFIAFDRWLLEHGLRVSRLV